MRSPSAARLIMLTGTSAGSGKSTAVRALAGRFRSLGREVFLIDEDAVWGERQLGSAPVDYTTASPLFHELIHKRRDAGGVPTPDQVVRAFERLMNDALSRSAMWLQDWCWPDLLDGLGWDSQVARVTSRRLQQIGAAVTPRVIYLRVDASEALRRALEERGPVWFNRYAGAQLDQPVTASMVDHVAAAKREAEPHGSMPWRAGQPPMSMVRHCKGTSSKPSGGSWNCR